MATYLLWGPKDFNSQEPLLADGTQLLQGCFEGGIVSDLRPSRGEWVGSRDEGGGECFRT